MPRLAAFGSGLLVLALASGCTSHGGNEPSEQEREPAQPQIEQVTPAPVEPVTFGPITPLSHKPFAGAIGDVSGDGQPDVVALCHASEAAVMLVLRGEPDGRFSEREPVIVQASGVALGDLDGDGDLDAFLTDARSEPAYRVALNDGAGNFTVGERLVIPGRYGGELRGSSLADLDSDGDLDAIVPLWDGAHRLANAGRGSFHPGRAIAAGRDCFDTALGDLDRDGVLDLVATCGATPARDRYSYDSSGASAWILRGAEGLLSYSTIEIAGAREVEIGDLDGDGRLEIVVSGTSGLTVIRDALGEPQLESLEVATDGPLLLADVLDPPGLDLITSSYTQSRIHVLAGQGWQKTSFDAGSYVVGLYAADVAHDGGRADVVVLNAGPPGGDRGEPFPSIEVLFAGG